MNASKCRHLVVATGGTGGHVFPALAIADAYRKCGGTVSMVIGGRNADQHLALARARTLTAVAIPAPRRATSQAGRVAFPVRLTTATLRAACHLWPRRGALVLGMGSFAAVPTCLAAVLLKCPIALHEGNTVVGRANRTLARWARVLMTAFPLRPGQNTAAPVECLGFPVREALLEASAMPHDMGGVPRTPGLVPGKPVLLVFGGSQGAAAVNAMVDEAFDLLAEDAGRCQVLHLTGTDDNAERVAHYEACRVTAVVKRFESNMEQCYQDASLVVCRAGAATIAELALFGRAPILVPLPTAAKNHQAANAAMVDEVGGGIMLQQGQQSAAQLTAHIRAWQNEPAIWQNRGHKLQRLARPRAAMEIAERLLRF